VIASSNDDSAPHGHCNIRSVSGPVNQLVETQAHNYEGQVLENDTNNAATDGSRPPITPLPNDPSGSLETKKKNDRTRFKERKIKKMIPLLELFKDEKFPKYYVLTFPDVDIGTKLNVITVDTELTAKIGKAQKISKLNKSSLLIEVKSDAQGKKLTLIKKLAEITVTAELHRTLNTVKGTVVSETMSQCSTEKLMSKLKTQGVTKIERMKTRVNGELVDTNRYILTFERCQLPSLIKLTDWHHEIVDQYIPQPTRCSRCQKFGHFKKWCRKQVDTCVRCGQEGHFGNNCSNNYKCVNCGLEHAASSKDCEIYKFKCEVMATMARNHVTHYEATEMTKEVFREE